MKTYYCYKGVLKKSNDGEIKIIENLSTTFRIILILLGLLFLVTAYFILHKPDAFASPPPSFALPTVCTIGIVFILMGIISNRFVLVKISSYDGSIKIFKQNIFFRKNRFQYIFNDIEQLVYISYLRSADKSDSPSRKTQIFAAELHLKDGTRIRFSNYSHLKQVQQDVSKLIEIVKINPLTDIYQVPY